MNIKLSSPSVSIHLLAQRVEWAETVAHWLFQCWPEAFEDRWSVAQERVRGRCQEHRRPMAMIACVDGQPVGTVSLIEDTAPASLGRSKRYIPTLSGLYVLPEWRRRGIGYQLCNRAIEVAGQLGCVPLYLYTREPEYYLRSGWHTVDLKSGCLRYRAA